MATLITCDGEWQHSEITGNLQCQGVLIPVNNPPLTALDGQAVADLTLAAVTVFALAFVFRFIRRLLGN